MVDRAKLRQLLHEQPTWSNRQYAEAVGHCRKWVQKWKKRLQTTDPNDHQVLYSQSRARKTSPKPYHPEVIARILALRDHPPEAVPRKLGAPAILYYLHHDEQIRAGGHRLPRSTSTLWKILDAHQRILRAPLIQHLPFDRPEPMETWEIDFTDVSSAQANHTDKQQHQVEAFAVVDRGSSILVDLQVSDDYQAETALLALASTLMEQGLPKQIVFDRDPRLVGSWSSDEFPSAWMRFLLSLGVEPVICPPHRPDLKPFVERYFRTLNSECVRVKHPADVGQTREVFDDHHYRYNHHRPNQSKACGNLPPYVAFPSLPHLPTIPQQVDPDHWLLSYHNRLFKRRVTSSGRIQIGRQRYFVRRDLAGRHVVCRLDAHRRVFEVLLENRVLKTTPIKELYDEVLEFGEYLELMLKEAEAERRRLERKRRLRAA